ncbi:rho guanine nucleotide exchange factor 40-like [Osmerus eperlanus]|uniref:rho guanine nucleotide exchange factor 40-like n=1 Tax=Osmerus eperlanus TaxID=29151 RepID=UPI002E0F31D9
MGSEAVEDCVQGALSSLYPPFESTAPPLLSQVFSVLESTYQHDSLRYLLDYFVPAKHLLHKLQQHACSQYLGCLFLHSGWPLCLGEKGGGAALPPWTGGSCAVPDFYLQVVPFSTRCPRLALKCLAPGGRNVQEILVPESQHSWCSPPSGSTASTRRGATREREVEGWTRVWSAPVTECFVYPGRTWCTPSSSTTPPTASPCPSSRPPPRPPPPPQQPPLFLGRLGGVLLRGTGHLVLGRGGLPGPTSRRAG